MENRNEMLRRVTALEPQQAVARLRRVRKEWAADTALTAPLLRALGFRNRAAIEEERRTLEALAGRGPLA